MGACKSEVTVASRSSWYRYYAGYSRAFVTDTIDHLGLTKGSTILDPWNGSGTTTAVAAEAGYEVVGFDAESSARSGGARPTAGARHRPEY